MAHFARSFSFYPVETEFSILGPLLIVEESRYRVEFRKHFFRRKKSV
jgi:hypothetical protein